MNAVQTQRNAVVACCNEYGWSWKKSNSHVEAVNILYNRVAKGDGRQLRRARTILETTFLDLDLKELVEQGLSIDEANAMQKKRDEDAKLREQQSESDISPIKPRELEKELREVRKESVQNMDSTDEYEQSGQSGTESDTPVEAEFESNRTKAARAQRGRGLGGRSMRGRGRGRGMGETIMRDPAPKKKQTRGPKKQKQPENYTHWPFLEYTSSPEKK